MFNERNPETDSFSPWYIKSGFVPPEPSVEDWFYGFTNTLEDNGDAPDLGAGSIRLVRTCRGKFATWFAFALAPLYRNHS